MILKLLMEKRLLPNPYTITEEDFREHRSIGFGGTITDFVQKSDIGKRIFLRGGLIEMENEQQRRERESRVRALPESLIPKLKWREE